MNGAVFSGTPPRKAVNRFVRNPTLAGQRSSRVTAEPALPALVRVAACDRSSRADYILQVRSPQSILPAEGLNLRRTAAAWTHAGRTPPVRRHGTALLPEGCRVTARAFPGAGGRGVCPVPRHANRGQSILPVGPFVVVLCPAPPVAHQRNAHCLASIPSGLPAGSYSGHSPRLRGLKHPADHGKAPGTSPAPAALPALAISFAPWVTSLEGIPLGTAAARPALPGGRRLHRTLRGDFGGPNVEASPYPSASAVRGSAPSPTALTGKPSRAFCG